MSNILQEVDDALRRDRIEKLWKTYGNFVLGGVGLIILGVAVVSGYTSWNDSVRTHHTERLLALIESDQFPGNLQPEALQIRPPLRGIGLINGAAVFLQQKKPGEALKLFEYASLDASIPSEIRHLATLMRVRLLSEDKKSQEDLVQILAPLVQDKNSPWQPYAALEAAALAADRNQDFDQARGYLKTVTARQDLPQSLHAKAQALDRIYASKQKNSDKTGDNS